MRAAKSFHAEGSNRTTADSLGHTLANVERLTRSLLAFAWLAAAVVFSFGGAGVVARGDNFAGDQTRPELTWRFDREMAPGIARAADEARLVADGTGKLADAARSALVDLLADRTDALADDLMRGDVWISDITSRADTISKIIADLPYVDSPALYGSGTRARIGALRQVVAAIAPLPDRWKQLEVGTVPAVQVAALLQSHDTIAFQAAQAGVRQDYPNGIAILARASAELDQAALLRDQLAANVDVSTLSDWIERNRQHDEALSALYQALIQSGGLRSTPEVKAAIERYSEAEKLLPPDTRALVVILGDIALGGVNQAAIAIETVRGSIAASSAGLD